MRRNIQSLVLIAAGVCVAAAPGTAPLVGANPQLPSY